jgi:hypothetical protein
MSVDIVGMEVEEGSGEPAVGEEEVAMAGRRSAGGEDKDYQGKRGGGKW